jgi:hypothetical protein
VKPGDDCQRSLILKGDLAVAQYNLRYTYRSVPARWIVVGINALTPPLGSFGKMVGLSNASLTVMAPVFEAGNLVVLSTIVSARPLSIAVFSREEHADGAPTHVGRLAQRKIQALNLTVKGPEPIQFSGKSSVVDPS